MFFVVVRTDRTGAIIHIYMIYLLQAHDDIRSGSSSFQIQTPIVTFFHYSSCSSDRFYSSYNTKARLIRVTQESRFCHAVLHISQR